MAISTEAAAFAIFLFTYIFLAFDKFPGLRLDRTGGVLVGAVLMVAFGVMSFDDAWKAIDGQTIVLLTGMMILNVYLEEAGFFEWAARHVLSLCGSAIMLLIVLTFISGILSALFLNDTICLMLTIPLVQAVKSAKLPVKPYLVALAMSANVGSVMTVTGNPQNMLIHVYGHIGYLPFFLRLAPVGLVGLLILTLMLLVVYGRQLKGKKIHIPSPEESSAQNLETNTQGPDVFLLSLTALVLVGVLTGFALSNNLAIIAMSGAAALLVVARRPAQEILAKVDWVLLVFFSGLFIVISGVQKTGAVEQLAAWAHPIYGDSLNTQVPVFCGLTVVASNVVSNVPFVILARDMIDNLIDPSLMWLVLAMASTFAGNLTLPGSVATLIVLRLAGEEHKVGFFEFLLIGIPVTVLTTAAGAYVLVATKSWF